jgi:hypothetical protein
MKAIEVKGVVDNEGNLSLDTPIPVPTHGSVRVIVLYSDEHQEEEMELDPDDTPLEEVKASLRRALQESKSGQRIPLAQMWDGIDTTSLP